MRFPDEFLLGAASSATQVEGGDDNNSWFDWCRKGHIKDGSHCRRAADHWNRYEEDFELMASMGLKCYRMGLEWSRIEPQEGCFSDEAIEHYRSMIESLLQKDIRPLITLFHFSLPLWLYEKDGFENPESIEYFARYAKFAADNLGDLVSEFITINEPNVYVAHGYFLGLWPPGKRSITKAMRVYKNLSLAHFKAYKAIHESRDSMISELSQLKEFVIGNDDIDPTFLRIDEKTKVGIAHHMQVFEPYSERNVLDNLACSLMRYLFQTCIMDSMTSGKLRFPIGFGKTSNAENPSDFLGINYYTRSAVKAKGFKNLTFPDRPQNSLGWDIYPEGLYEICSYAHERYNLPIWITENGSSDNDDTFRARYISEHLTQVQRAQKDSIPIERYYHWSLTDNFEWLEGESSRFGLIKINYNTQERKIKKSGLYYAEIAKSGKLSAVRDATYSIEKQQYK